MPEVVTIEEVFNTEGAAAFVKVGEGYVRQHWKEMGGVDLGHAVGFRFRKSKLLEWLDALGPSKDDLESIPIPHYSRAKPTETDHAC